MEDINPHLAKRNPREALHALKAQFRAYLAGVEPFNCKCGRNESVRDYWSRLLDNEDSDVLAALAVKIFSAMPVSMVDERAMSVVTWLNSPRWKRQKVPTIANQLIIRGFNQLDREILADSISDDTTTHSENMQQSLGSGNSFGNKEAGDFVPADEEWGRWLVWREIAPTPNSPSKFASASGEVYFAV
ncbi:hypothetical protein F5148DRAFT_1352744 [Russula earlei]|uniref:Uncharacterized protein n=1 Tax=Russula earlei TaxID=71964 RepID=A0ACC0TT68_9AGAM|nr:hypothetical protein F5148DRAFT_1352744 [Russula earlei]